MPKPIFKPNPHDYTKTSFLNWRFFKQDSPKSFLTLGEGYIKSSIELIAHVIENNHDKRADIFIFPILHNFNHGIELYLKGLVWTLNLLLKNNRGRDIRPGLPWDAKTSCLQEVMRQPSDRR